MGCDVRSPGRRFQGGGESPVQLLRGHGDGGEGPAGAVGGEPEVSKQSRQGLGVLSSFAVK